MQIWLETKQALRALRREVPFSLTVVATLALAVGSLSAVSSLAYQVLMRPLPFPASDRLALLYEGRTDSTARGNDLAPGTCKDFLQLRSFAGGGCWMRSENTLRLDGAAERIFGMRVTTGVLPTLGLPPQRGRYFDENDMNNGESLRIIAILPPGFRIKDEPVGLYTPLTLPAATWQDQSRSYLGAVARLSPNVTIAQAQREANSLAQSLAQRYPNDNRALRLDVRDMQEDLSSSMRAPIAMLWLTAALLLAVAIANLSNLFFTRTLERAPQFTLRESLGATGWRLFSEPLLEVLLLSSLGALAGLGLAAASFQVLRTLIPSALSASRDLHLEPAVLLFTLALTVLTGLASVGLPLLRAARPHFLRSGTQRSTASTESKGANALLASQVALTTVLLLAALLFVQSWNAATNRHLGFQPQGVALAKTGLPSPDFLPRLIARLESEPGVTEAALSSGPPLTWRGGRLGFAIEGQTCDSNFCQSLYREITPRYFAALNIPLRTGRAFDANDAAHTEKLVIVNATLARQFFGARDPLGQRIRFTDPNEPWRRIVGVVEDSRDLGPEAEPRPTIFVPFAQSTMSFAPPIFTVVRSSSGVQLALQAIQRAVAATDSRQPISDLDSYTHRLALENRLRSLESGLTAFFALSALALTGLGLYGLLSYRVTRRRREIGIRLALGADSWSLSRAISGASFLASLAGLAAGLTLALAAARWAEPLFFGVKATDPIHYSEVASLLVITFVFAAALPLRRALRVPPAESLRS